MRSLPPSASARAGVLSALLATALTAAAPSVQAQAEQRVPASNGDGMDLHLFRPAIDSKGFFSVNGADILGHNSFSFGMVIDYGHHLMPLNPNHGTDFLLEHSFAANLNFNYGIGNWVIVGISAPILLTGGDKASDIGPGPGKNYTDEGADSQALGFVGLHAKVRILRPDEHFVGLAILAQAGYGTGGARFLSAEPGFFYWPQAIIEKRFGTTGLRMGLNGGFRGHTGKNPSFGKAADGKNQLKSGVFEYSNLVTAGFGIGYRVLGPLNLDAETYMSYQLGGGSDSKQRLSAEALGGLKLFIQDSSFLMAAAGGGYLPGFQSATVRAVLGFVFEPPMGDKDHDGIKDDEDDCPDDPEDYDGFQDTRMDSPPGQYGCPDPDEAPRPKVRDGDRDGDGILDSRDKCPDEPEDYDGFKDKDGCPELDNDGDGIPDVKDRCINSPEDQDGFKDEDGCPEPDNDGDGIPDAKDSCKDEPETYNGTEDEDGCPDKGSVIVEKDNVLILDKILFETGSAKILPASFGILDAVTTTLKHHPEFILLEVQGHADIRGDEKANVRLTQARADSVVDALIKRGLPSSLLRSMGYGAYCPVDPGRTPEAFDKNRRVEFKIVRTNKGPTGVELGCDLASSKGITPKAP